MIRATHSDDFESIFTIINEAAEAYRGVIPDDRWKAPYMSRDALQKEIDSGVSFCGFEVDGELIGVMGTQAVDDVTLIRHAYTRTDHQGKGIGSQLLDHLSGKSDQSILIGTWARADWAIRFYERHGYVLVNWEEKQHLLQKYWRIPERQVETSVVLAKWS